MPLALGGVFDDDVAVESAHLDSAEANGDALLLEMYPDTTASLLPDWERVLALTPGDDEPLQSRRAKVVRKLRERGGLSIPYWLRLAESLGYEVEIVEPTPSMANWLCADDELFDEVVDYQWGLVIKNQPVYEFCAGESCAGEPLLWFESQTYLEELFTRLKPGHTDVYFVYET
ncbi:MAG: YmfQ family protein [Desulfobulbaceae bacterium]|nr:YmfQ family protein [Desulfobulbaceae bacterium]